MKLGVDRAGGLCGHAGDAFKLLLARGEEGWAVAGQVNDGAEPLHILCALAPPPVMGDPPRFAEEA